MLYELFYRSTKEENFVCRRKSKNELWSQIRLGKIMTLSRDSLACGVGQLTKTKSFVGKSVDNILFDYWSLNIKLILH